MANLITAQEVIELAFPENSNMREESISSTSIRIAEIKHIKPAFGNMYPMLGTTYADFTNEYIKPALAYFVKCEIISSIAIDMSNSGIAVANPQYQSAASDKQRQRLYDSEMSKAKVLLDDALAYISSHIEEFPDFVGTAPKQHYRNGGLILGGGVPARPTQVIGNPVSRQELDELTEKVNKKVDKVEGKGLSTNDYTNEERAEVAKIKGKANADYVAEAIGRVNADVERLDGRLDEVKDEITAIGNPFDDKGYYPKLTAGFADNLVGRGDVKEADFTFRASAAQDNIADDIARVKRIKGNTVVWNQLVRNEQLGFQQCSGTFSDGVYSITPEGDYPGITQTSPYKMPNGHRVLVTVSVKANTAIRLGLNYYGTAAQVTTLADGAFHTYGMFADFNLTSPYAGLIIFGTNAKEVFYMGQPNVYDLTKMFGAGNEPSSVEDFYARIPSGVDIHAHNEGNIISMHTEAIKTVGFNQWDEQWEVGGLNQSTGLNYDDQERIRSKGYVQVISGQDYYFCSPSAHSPYVYLYDSEFNFVSWIGLYNTRIFTIPSGVSYIRFYIAPGYGTVYNNDICINLSHSLYNNGKYKPYTPFTRELSVIKKYFPNGMRSIGNVFDSIEWDSSKHKWVEVQRIGEIDLGRLDWSYNAARTYFKSISLKGQYAFSGANKVNNLLTAKYSSVTGYQNYAGLVTEGIAFEDANAITVKDATYTNAAVFKSAMQGVMLYYELAEPIVTEIEENINFDYYVEDFGTEEALSDVPSTPFRADVVYTPNAVDDIRALLQRVSALETGAKAYPEVYVFSSFPAMDERGGIDIGRFKELSKAVEEEKMILFKENADSIEFFSPVFIGANVRYEEYEDPDSGDAYSLDVLELYLPGNRRWHFELKDDSELSDEIIYG